MTMELTPELQEKKIFLIEGLKKTYKDQYDAIQPLPYVKDRLYCVDKVFVEGGIEVCLAPELTRGTGGSWERLESYKSIYTDFRLNSKRRIIQGEPGYGKSTLTLQLAYDWCNDVSDSPMNYVEILILLRLRQLGSIKSLFRAIKSFLLFHEPRVSKRDIEKIINSCSSVHITLDGYDEYPGRDSNDNDDVHKIIKMKLFADIDVSLTTRYLPESLRKETKKAKLTGFDDKARDDYIRKAVVGNNDEAVEKIKQRLYENSILADLCQVPLIFVMFAHMAHDQRDVMKFKSVTQFFKHIIRCFYDHLNRKRKLTDNRHNRFFLHEMEHHELDKIAFEGLNKRNQQLSWIKTEFCERVGLESYHQYILIGILVEEDVVSDDSTVDNVLFTTMVRFYHKLFCEWYAAHHLVTLVKNGYDINQTLRFLDPVDLQYLFRFACGLDPDAGKKLINHLKSLPGGDTFAILCVLEQTGDINDIMDAVKDLCSRDVKIKRGDSALLQRSTIQLLEIASKNDIPISCLHLDYSSIKFEGDTIILRSGISLPKLLTVEKIHIDGSNVQYGNTRTVTHNDILNLFHYGLKCRRIKELMFSQLQLPSSVSPESFTDIMKTRNIQVRWRPFDIDFHLDLQNGHWEVDDFEAIRDSFSQTFSINDSDTGLQQRSKVQLLYIAANHDTPISCVHINKCAKRYGEESFLLQSRVRLAPLTTVEHICIEKGTGMNRMREIGNTEMKNILHFGMKCQQLQDISFRSCMLSLDNMSTYIPSHMKGRNIRVTWPEGGYRLNLQTGDWEVADLDPIRALCTKTVQINFRDSEPLQRDTIQLLENAAKYDIPITCLYLKKSFSYIYAGNIILESGLHLSCPASVKKVVIDTEERRNMTEKEVVDILMFVQQSNMLEELEFDGCVLPLTFSSESIPAELQSRNIKVFWSNYGYSLDLQSGVWKVNEDVVRKLCTKYIYIQSYHSELQQRCTIQLLENASNYGIPILCLYLVKSFSKIDAGDVILHSGLRLSCPVSVKKVVIFTERGREMTETEVVDILMFVKQSHMLKELTFKWCLLPQSIPAESIPTILKSRKVKVSWEPKYFIRYTFNLQSGQWMDINTRQVITDTEYNDTVRDFRTRWGHTKW